MTDERWYYSQDGKRYGPIPLAEIETLAASGGLNAEDQVWCDGMEDWSPAGSVAELERVIPPPLPATAPAFTRSAVPERPVFSWKVILMAASVIVAGILGVSLWHRQISPPIRNEMKDGQESRDDHRLFPKALDQARQKETMVHLQSLGSAYMSWLTDQVGAASAGARKIHLGTYSRRLKIDDVVADLRPSDTFFYMDEIDLKDGWGHPIEVWRGDELLMSQVILIRSPGRDGSFGGEEYDSAPFPATDYDRDIVWADGYFIQYPEGVGKR